MSLSNESFNNAFGDLDLELLDLILKGHFSNSHKILDVGCGEGRNLIYFMQRDFDIYAIDTDKSSVDLVRYIMKSFDKVPDQIIQGNILESSFPSTSMDVIICSRVLHFSQDENYFMDMWHRITDILTPEGILYLSCDSMIGFENKVTKIDEDKWQFSDGSIRFLLSDCLLKKMRIEVNYEFLVPMKTIHYGDQHAQTILCLKKRP